MRTEEIIDPRAKIAEQTNASMVGYAQSEQNFRAIDGA